MRVLRYQSRGLSFRATPPSVRLRAKSSSASAEGIDRSVQAIARLSGAALYSLAASLTNRGQLIAGIHLRPLPRDILQTLAPNAEEIGKRLDLLRKRAQGILNSTEYREESSQHLTGFAGLAFLIAQAWQVLCKADGASSGIPALQPDLKEWSALYATVGEDLGAHFLRRARIALAPRPPREEAKPARIEPANLAESNLRTEEPLAPIFLQAEPVVELGPSVRLPTWLPSAVLRAKKSARSEALWEFERVLSIDPDARALENAHACTRAALDHPDLFVANLRHLASMLGGKSEEAEASWLDHLARISMAYWYAIGAQVRIDYQPSLLPMFNGTMPGLVRTIWLSKISAFRTFSIAPFFTGALLPRVDHLFRPNPAQLRIFRDFVLAYASGEILSPVYPRYWEQETFEIRMTLACVMLGPFRAHCEKLADQSSRKDPTDEPVEHHPGFEAASANLWQELRSFLSTLSILDHQRILQSMRSVEDADPGLMAFLLRGATATFNDEDVAVDGLVQSAIGKTRARNLTRTQRRVDLDGLEPTPEELQEIESRLG